MGIHMYHLQHNNINSNSCTDVFLTHFFCTIAITQLLLEARSEITYTKLKPRVC